MCVIAYGIKKNFQDEWFKQCCLHNPDGFFVTRVNTGASIRTLEYAEAEAFFKKSKANDKIVLHARIKSVGPVNINNVHGWEAAGMQFCHNGTLSINVNDGRTDSETLFKDVIVPLMKVYKGKLNKKLRSVIASLAGKSKFLIVYKGKVYLFGEYSEKGGCYFSNMYWEPLPRYNAKGGNKRGSKGYYDWESSSYYDDYYAGYWGYNTPSDKSYKENKKTTKSKSKTPHSVLPPYNVLQALLSNAPSVQAFSRILPASSWLTTTQGASYVSYQNLARFLYPKATEAEVMSHSSQLGIETYNARKEECTFQHLRKWLYAYGMVLIKLITPYLDKEELKSFRHLTAYILKYAGKTVPEEERDKLLITATPENLKVVKFCDDSIWDVPFSHVFSFLYRTHLLLNFYAEEYTDLDSTMNPVSQETKIQQFKINRSCILQEVRYTFADTPGNLFLNFLLYEDFSPSVLVADDFFDTVDNYYARQGLTTKDITEAFDNIKEETEQ